MEEEHTDESEEVQAKPQSKEVAADVIQSLRNAEANLHSPINLNITLMREINLPVLVWHHFESEPKKMKLTNTGHTAILSAKWFQERPYIAGGPLNGTYVFSQMHFHWGANDMEGSEHTVDGTQHPGEIHVVFFKSAYLVQETALKEKDGVIVLVYFLKLQSGPNPRIQILLDLFPDVREPHTSAKVQTVAIDTFLQAFASDYFIYWGNIKTSISEHLILWTICRQPMGISVDQAKSFRTLLDENEQPLKRNFRNLESNTNKHIYHVNPSKIKHATLLPLQDKKTYDKMNRPLPKNGKRN